MQISVFLTHEIFICYYEIHCGVYKCLKCGVGGKGGEQAELVARGKQTLALDLCSHSVNLVLGSSTFLLNDSVL